MKSAFPRARKATSVRNASRGVAPSRSRQPVSPAERPRAGNSAVELDATTRPFDARQPAVDPVEPERVRGLDEVAGLAQLLHRLRTLRLVDGEVLEAAREPQTATVHERLHAERLAAPAREPLRAQPVSALDVDGDEPLRSAAAEELDSPELPVSRVDRGHARHRDVLEGDRPPIPPQDVRLAVPAGEDPDPLAVRDERRRALAPPVP